MGQRSPSIVSYWGKSLIDQRSGGEKTSDFLFLSFPDPKGTTNLSQSLHTTSCVSLYILGPPKTPMANSGRW